jgi:hypothetical protein
MSHLYERGDWEAPEIEEWRDDRDTAAGAPDGTRQFAPFGVGLGMRFTGFFCFPRQFGCFPF